MAQRRIRVLADDWDIATAIGGKSHPETIVAPTDGAEMVLVQRGPFTMGTSTEELTQIARQDKRLHPVYVSEVPARRVHLDTYYIDRYPVTNYQYMKFTQSTGHRRPLHWDHPMWNQPMQPVIFVGWADARAYARWAGKSIPSEAQWEKAARGTDGRWWSWGCEFYPERCNSREAGLGRTSEIGQYHQGESPFGCYDMCGNVWEMCEGTWAEEKPPMRGGCFLGSKTFVRATCRWSPEDTDTGAHWLGFRCVKAAPQQALGSQA